MHVAEALAGPARRRLDALEPRALRFTAQRFHAGYSARLQGCDIPTLEHESVRKIRRTAGKISGQPGQEQPLAATRTPFLHECHLSSIAATPSSRDWRPNELSI